MNEEISEGIKFAMSKGETLEQAMQTFYNAGYSKEEVDEAARFLQNQLHLERERGIHAVLPDLKTFAQKTDAKNKTSAAGAGSQTIQKVSSYESAPQGENPRKKMIIFVSILLAVLIAVFAGIFFFRNYLLELFAKMLG